MQYIKPVQTGYPEDSDARLVVRHWDREGLRVWGEVQSMRGEGWCS